MTGARVTIDGRDAALAELGRLLARAEHPRGMYENIGVALVTSTQRRFETSTSPAGAAWPPSIRAIAGGGKTLVDSARLMQSIAFVATDANVEIGTNVLYAAIHQFGGEIKQPERTQTIYRRHDKKTGELSDRFVRKSKATFAEDVSVGARTIHMPARPFIGLDDDDEREIVAIAEDWLRDEGARP